MLDFPSNPTNGQIFTGPGGVQWFWDTEKWTGGFNSNAFAPIASPAFSGNPTAPTPPSGDADTSIATTQFVSDAVATSLHDVGRNYLHNSMFNVAQRGAGPFTAQGVTLDRWSMIAGSDTFSIGQATLTATDRTQIGDESGSASLQNTFTGNAAAGAFHLITQRIEDVRRLTGKPITVSFYAAANATLKLGVNVLQSPGTGGSPSGGGRFATGTQATITNTFARYTVPFTLPSLTTMTLGTNNDHYTGLEFWFSSGATNNAIAGNVGVQSGIVKLWGVQLELGPTATPLEKLDPITQLQQCQRFYQTGYANLAGYIGAGTAAAAIFPLPVPMRGTTAFTPTFTQQTNCASSTINPYGTTHYQVSTVGSALGGFICTGTFIVSADL